MGENPVDRPETCPFCASRYQNIRGLVYGPGAHIGTQCENEWHKGADYDPNVLTLSAYDEEFLSEQKVSLR